VDTDVVAGDRATLDCRAPRGEPEPRLRWLKDGGRLRTSERVTTDVQGGTLTISDAGRDDAGSYVCVASNVAGERRSAPAQIRIRGRAIHCNELTIIRGVEGLSCGYSNFSNVAMAASNVVPPGECNLVGRAVFRYGPMDNILYPSTLLSLARGIGE